MAKFLQILKKIIQHAVLAPIAALLLCTSCTTWTKHAKKEGVMEMLTQKAIFSYLQPPKQDLFFENIVGKSPAKIDQMVRTRDSLIVYGRLYFDDPMYSDELKKPLTARSYQLIIPDSLDDIFVLTSDTADYELDYALIYQFSPLLPTHDPDIYFMEMYMWFNSCEEDDCIRMLFREYLRFRVKGKEVAFIDMYGNNKNDNAFLGGGRFSRKKMEEALPGEKISKPSIFRW